MTRTLFDRGGRSQGPGSAPGLQDSPGLAGEAVQDSAEAAATAGASEPLDEPAQDALPTITEHLPEFAQQWLPEGQAHPALLAGATFLVALLLAKAVGWLATVLLRVVARRTKTRVDDAVLVALRPAVVRTVVLLGAWLAIEQLATEAMPLLWARRLLLTLVLFVWLASAWRAGGRILRAMAQSERRFLTVETRTLPLFDNLVKVVLVGLALYVVLEVWGLDPTAWLASAGVAGIALGFAAKDTLANLFAGVFIIGDAPYQIGDYIVLDSGHRGRVLHIGLRSTKILTRDDVQITIPNSIIGNGAIVNETSGTPQYRIRVLVGVAYGSDIDRVRDLLLEVASNATTLLKDPEPRVRFRGFGSSSLDVELLGWIQDPEQRGLVLDALNTAVYQRFAEAGVEIAFPQTDLHIRTAPAGWGPTPPATQEG